ncbi:MAG: hypothetical protein CMM39_03425 [Rhodospirillaceae bacterium]|jgi:hypothetical protein|nr:hypothetical protein [Rhodospirillaceae bacterium]MBT7731077.1 hypothetical protein [Rhodospirillaceae bacterium]MDG1273132.1 hypothetical protein [Alphaproteobacteria bacterium]MDG1888567.1 hypothetical protein [Alphaproteobacteria bacterium]|tara:strand:- start:468 stop:653 length:186 start_codon:yes stop_codon:yes gene_type:complete
MDNKNLISRHMPEEIKQAVGADRAEVAIKMANAAAQRLDRDNQIFEEPSHVYRAVSWVAKK